MEHDTLIVRTNYFGRHWPWVKRTMLSGVVLFALMLMDSDFGVLPYLLACIALFIIFSIPVDELAADRTYLYHIRRSIIPFFTVIKRYEISKIKSINCLGSYSAGNDLLAFLSLGQLYQSVNSLKIILKNDSLIDFRVSIYKDDVEEVISEIRNLL